MDSSLSETDFYVRLEYHQPDRTLQCFKLSRLPPILAIQIEIVVEEL